MDGYGVCTFETGEKYDGQMKGYEKHGLGLSTLPSGEKYGTNCEGGKEAGPRGMHTSGRITAQGRMERGSEV